MKSKANFILGVATCVLLLIASNVACAQTRAESVPLYCVTQQDGVSTILYDGFRTVKVDASVVVSDASGGALDSLDALSGAIGTAPDLTDSKVGDLVGETLGDLIVASLTLDGAKVVAIDVEKRLPRPTIGIAWASGKQLGGAERKIADALFRNGARAKFLPQVATPEECDAVMSPLDGFFMPGGADVNPKLYGEEPYPHGSVGCDDARDVSDVLTSRWAIEHNLPAIWVCRGEQVLNVALGGALIQDVPSYQGARVLKGELEHVKATPLPDEGAPSTYGGAPATSCMPAHFRVVVDGLVHGHGRHRLGTPETPAISADSKVLLPIVGRRDFPSVFTSHHQAADPVRIGKGLTVVATAEDGIVEALEYQANDFSLACQFHVEYDTLDSDPAIAQFSNAFFQALIERARK